MTDNNIQFKRTYQIIIGEIGSRKGLEIVGDEDAGEGLQMTFKVKKHLNNKEQSNTCTIDLYNLSEESIKYIDRENMAIILKIGYKGKSNQTNNIELFRGIISELETDDRSRGSDRKTSLKCVPSDSITYQPTISKTFPANTTPRQIINYLVSESGTLARASFNSANVDQKFPFGYPVEGSVKSILNELSRDFDLQYRIDGKRLYVNDPNRYESSNSVTKAFVISPDTGLLGVPSKASSDGSKSKDDTTKKDGIKFRALANPLIRPGSAISLKDTVIEGIFRVNSTEFSGDWRGNRWEVTCHCARLSGTEL